MLQFIVSGGLPTTMKAGLAMLGLSVGQPRLPVQARSETAGKTLAGRLATLAVEPVGR